MRLKELPAVQLDTSNMGLLKKKSLVLPHPRWLVVAIKAPPDCSVQSKGSPGEIGPFFNKWPLAEARVGHLLHNVNGEIFAEINENNPL